MLGHAGESRDRTSGHSAADRDGYWIREDPPAGSKTGVHGGYSSRHSGPARSVRYFLGEDTAGGVLPFLFRDQQLDGYPLDDDLGSWLQTEDGTPLRIESWWLVQFGQQEPAYSRLSGRRFEIQFSLVVLP